jgi:hypothetical protein
MESWALIEPKFTEEQQFCSQVHGSVLGTLLWDRQGEHTLEHNKTGPKSFTDRKMIKKMWVCTKVSHWQQHIYYFCYNGLWVTLKYLSTERDPFPSLRPQLQGTDLPKPRRQSPGHSSQNPFSRKAIINKHLRIL